MTATAAEHEETVTAEEVAAKLRITVQTVYRHARRGVIPGFRVGRLWRFYESDIDAHRALPQDPWAQSSRGRGRRRTS